MWELEALQILCKSMWFSWKPQRIYLFPCLPCVFQGRGTGSAESVFRGAVLSITDNLLSWEEIFSPSLHLLHAFQVMGNFALQWKSRQTLTNCLISQFCIYTGQLGNNRDSNIYSLLSKVAIKQAIKASEKLTPGHLEDISQDAVKISGYKEDLAVHMNLKWREEMCLAEGREMGRNNSVSQKEEWLGAERMEDAIKSQSSQSIVSLVINKPSGCWLHSSGYKPLPALSKSSFAFWLLLALEQREGGLVYYQIESRLWEKLLVSPPFLTQCILWDLYKKLASLQSGVPYLLCGSPCYYVFTVFSSCGAEEKLCLQSDFSEPWRCWHCHITMCRLLSVSVAALTLHSTPC